MENKYYITRREDLRDHADKTEISLQEWMGFVRMDPDMRLENETTVKLPDGSDYTYPSPGKAVWLGGFFARQAAKFEVRVVDEPDRSAIGRDAAP